MKVLAPAKVNLYLEIGARRADGYHAATSVMHTLELCDELTFETFELPTGAGLQVEWTCECHEGVEPLEIPQESNLVYKAIFALAEALELAPDLRICVHIDKYIPHAGGLGGGSSNAAAALRAACEFWEIDPLSEPVVRVAQGLGADVAFFLRGGCVHCEGVGDEYVRSLKAADTPLVLVRPDEGVSTAAAYAAFDALEATIPSPRAEMLAAQSAAEIPVFNNLAPASEVVLPSLVELREWLVAQPEVDEVLLCGSGSTTCGFCKSDEDAQAVAVRARALGYWACATKLSSGKS